MFAALQESMTPPSLPTLMQRLAARRLRGQRAE
jgi:hypothetical protein